MQADDPLRIANVSGFYGDRSTAMDEILEGGPIDVITGDYLAELTLLILGRDRARDPELGYAKTFLRQLRRNLHTIAARGVKVVVNAGGLNPPALAAAVTELARGEGLGVSVAYVGGDDLSGRAQEFDLPEGLSANAYLGGFGIARCLEAGADVVITGRVTDASLVVGAGVSRFGWTFDDLDALAGAVAVGHVIECGAQATGGNYAFFAEHDVRRPGMPIAELHPDGSAVITKHPGTGGAVTVGTVTAQLLYEIAGPRYANPDVTARFDTVELAQQGPDRVWLRGTRGEPPPPTLKVCVNAIGGYRNEVTFVLTGLDIERKAELVRQQMEAELATLPPAELRWMLGRTDQPDAATEQGASALLRCVVRDPSPEPVGRRFSGAAVELGLSSYPGFHLTAPPGDARPYGVLGIGYVPADEVEHVARLPDGDVAVIPRPSRFEELVPVAESSLPPSMDDGSEGLVSTPIGRLLGARSGDKGGSANVGVWARDSAAFEWMARTLTVERFRDLIPEAGVLPVTRHLFPNLLAVNFVVEDILDEGVASATRFDPQAKGLAEWLRSRVFDIPVGLFAATAPSEEPTAEGTE